MVSPYFKHRLLDLTFIQVLSIKLLHLGSSGFMALISTWNLTYELKLFPLECSALVEYDGYLFMYQTFWC